MSTVAFLIGAVGAAIGFYFLIGKSVFFKTCPYCKSSIMTDAMVCPECTRKLEDC